jgi:hypothetical protein
MRAIYVHHIELHQKLSQNSKDIIESLFRRLCKEALQMKWRKLKLYMVILASQKCRLRTFIIIISKYLVQIFFVEWAKSIS